MRTFEECLKAARWDTLRRNYRYGVKMIARKKARKRRMVLRGAAMLLGSVSLLVWAAECAAQDRPAGTPELSLTVTEGDQTPVIPLEMQEAEVPKTTAEPLVIYYDVPISHELQDKLRAACEESGIPMELALAVIWEETDFRNVSGDDGESQGYMQVQEKWHWDRMERLGVEDLSDPEGNFRVGCDFLAELLDKHPLDHALTCYNSGEVRGSDYAERVMAYQELLYEWSC